MAALAAEVCTLKFKGGRAGSVLLTVGVTSNEVDGRLGAEMGGTSLSIGAATGEWGAIFISDALGSVTGALTKAADLLTMAVFTTAAGVLAAEAGLFFAGDAFFTAGAAFFATAAGFFCAKGFLTATGLEGIFCLLEALPGGDLLAMSRICC